MTSQGKSQKTSRSSRSHNNTYSSAPTYVQPQQTGYPADYSGNYATYQQTSNDNQQYDQNYQLNYPSTPGYTQPGYTQQQQTSYPGNYAAYHQKSNENKAVDQNYQMNQWMYATHNQDMTWNEKWERQGYEGSNYKN